MKKETAKENFWQEQKRAKEVSQKIADLEKTLLDFTRLEQDLKDLKELVLLSEKDKSLEKDILKVFNDFEQKLQRLENELFFSGPYDKANALLTIRAGAGGQDAQDWVRMLLRMYQRFAEKQGWSVVLLHQSFGQAIVKGEPGFKEVTCELKGRFAYGFLKKETGTHRLVRISPFSAQKLRHTSFAQVEVLPVLSSQDSAVLINEKDIKLETFRASGPGGQYVNRRESAVRLTHLPTGIVATCQSERTQGLNRDKAMQILRARLYHLKEKQRIRKMEELKGKKTSPSWGNQIRTYVLHPYQLVKDLRTGFETNDVEGVLSGEIDEFIKIEARTLTNVS